MADDSLIGDEACELEPPSKRRRRGNNSDTPMDPDDSQFWFHDGDIVLGLEHKYFKVHRAKLACSLIFETMLDLPQPDLVESFDGYPLVTLPLDTVCSWTLALNWMYDRSSFELRTTTFDTIAQALRISTKYEILELRRWCKQQLFSRWPHNIVDMTTEAMPNAAEAICLARELDIPEILPAAFYALSIQRWCKGVDGGRSHMILSPDDLRRLVVGREELQDRLTCLLANWDSRTNTEFFKLCRMCQPPCTLWLSKRLVPAYHSPYGCWLLRDLQQLSATGLDGLDPCSVCKGVVKHTIEDLTRQLHQSIPRYFLL